MKKLALLLALCMIGAFSLYGCGSNDTSAPEESVVSEAAEDTSAAESSQATEANLEGEWEISTIIDAENNAVSMEDYCAANGVDASTLDIKYAFTTDGNVSGFLMGVEVSGTYTFDGKTITMVFDSGTYEYQYNEDGTVSYTDAASGMTSVLTKK